MSFTNGKVVRVVMRATRGTDQQVNTFHYDLNDTGGYGDNDPQLLADAFRDDVMGPFGNLYHSDWTIQPVEVIEEIDPLSPNDARSGWTSGTAAAGSKSLDADYLPAAVCNVGKLVTDRVGRRARGRVFIGGSWAEADQSDGNWSPGARTSAQLYLDAIPREPDLAGVGSGVVARWSVYSRTARAANADLYLFRVISATAQLPVHWLRSRAA